MGRPHRVDVGNVVYHVINRGNFHGQLFENAVAYDDFMEIMARTLPLAPMRILAFCIMPNHWHMVLYPEHDGDLSRFMQRLTLTHAQRRHAQQETRGYGHIYQGRYKSFVVQDDRHFLNVARYVESNTSRTGLAPKAEDWQWSSGYVRTYGTEVEKKILSAWPTQMPEDYLAWLNDVQPEEEISNIRDAIEDGRPYGTEEWTADIIEQFGLETLTHGIGRPRKKINETEVAKN